MAFPIALLPSSIATKASAVFSIPSVTCSVFFILPSLIHCQSSQFLATRWLLKVHSYLLDLLISLFSIFKKSWICYDEPFNLEALPHDRSETLHSILLSLNVLHVALSFSSVSELDAGPRSIIDCHFYQVANDPFSPSSIIILFEEPYVPSKTSPVQPIS